MSAILFLQLSFLSLHLSSGFNDNWLLPVFQQCPNETDQTISNCHCDAKCVQYGDCCLDKADVQVPSEEVKLPTCTSLTSADQPAVYVYQFCPSIWRGSEVDNRCSLTDSNFENGYLNDYMVFSHTTNRLYQNIYCAICNQDTKNLKYLEAQVSCSKPDSFGLTIGLAENASTPENFNLDPQIVRVDNYEFDQYSLENVTYNPEVGIWQKPGPNPSETINCTVDQTEVLSHLNNQSLPLRECESVGINTCPSNWTNQTILNLCKYYSVKSMTLNSKQYKNAFCAICNGQNVHPGFSLGSVITRIKPSMTLRHLFDVKLPFGDSIETGQSCNINNGQIYDPVKKKCISYGCPALFNKQSDGKCVPRSDQRSVANASLITKACKTLQIESNEFVLINHSTVYVNFTNKYYFNGSFELSSNETELVVCFDDNLRTLPLSASSSNWETVSSLVCLLVSIISLILYLVTFTLVPSLRSESGKLQAFMCISLLLAHISFVSSSLLEPSVQDVKCVVSGIVMHYFYLAAFFWMNILSFDIWYTFCTKFRKESRKHWALYTVYGWMSPALIVTGAVVNEYWSVTRNKYQPLYGFQVCFISQRGGLIVYFVSIFALLTLSNVVFFTLTIREFLRSKQIAVNASIKENNLCLKLYTKLGITMGLTWLFGFAASFLDSPLLWYPFMIFNGLQGLLIFISIACRKQNLTVVRSKLSSVWDSGFSNLSLTSSWSAVATTNTTTTTL